MTICDICECREPTQRYNLAFYKMGNGFIHATCTGEPKTYDLCPACMEKVNKAAESLIENLKPLFKNDKLPTKLVADWRKESLL